MRTIAHLSDLHFGRVDTTLVQPLLSAVWAQKPHLVVVSGDLTQRARPREFAQARDFLESLPRPRIVVPGNHDVPLYNLAARFVRPLARFRQYISEELVPTYVDEEIAIVGASSARSFTVERGRINEQQIQLVLERLGTAPPSAVKVLVTHHPFDLPEGHDERALLGRAAMAVKRLSTVRVDIFLAGHVHRSHSAHLTSRYRLQGWRPLVVHAATALSTRRRGETNSFNVLHIEGGRLTVERYAWEGERTAFLSAERKQFCCDSEGWKSLSDV